MVDFVPYIKFVPFKEGTTQEDLIDYIYTHDDDIFLVSVRFRYKHENRWTYIVDACSRNEDGNIMWFNDWYEGQEYIEYIGITQMI